MTLGEVNELKQAVLISGGAGKIGTEICLELSRNGFLPIALDCHQANLESLKNLATTEKLEILTYKCDITNNNEVTQIKESLEKLSICVSSLVLLASIDRKLDSLNAESEKFEFENWTEDFELGLTANYNLCKIYFSDLINQESAQIIFVSSDLGIIGPDQELYCSCGKRNADPRKCLCPTKPAVYSAVKFGQIGLVKHLASSWGVFNIHTNAICPTGFSDDLPLEFRKKLARKNPMNRLISYKEISGLIQFLLTSESSFINGAVIPLDGGRSAW
jgi:NAD(P)-dependent dehydrogenase (short-subunit alcohol dehydrogenase family)